MHRHNLLVTIIVPVHNESENIEWFHNRLLTATGHLGYAFEILYVDDGSTDSSLKEMKKLASRSKNTQYLSFSKNFGKEAATSAGLHYAKGDCAIMIDSDGQHPPELITKLLEKWASGYKVVAGIRLSHGEGRLHKHIGSKVFYEILKMLGSDASSHHGLTDFRLVDREVIDEFKKLSEHNRVTRNLIDWLGFSRTTVPFEAQQRHAGQASYSMRKLTKLAIDGIVKHSTRPLKFIGLLGFLISFATALLGIFVITEEFILADPLALNISGTAMLAIFISFMVGVVLTCQGLLALYIENVYYETQNRPLYIVKETSQQ